MTADPSHTDDDQTPHPDRQSPPPDRQTPPTGETHSPDVLADGGENQPTDDRGAGEIGRGDMPTPDEMTLDELRDEIRGIDEDLVELIARRTYVADTIAQVKRDEGLPTTDETQEQRVMDRAGENAERFDVDANLVKAIFRLLIELNKVEQRESR